MEESRAMMDVIEVDNSDGTSYRKRHDFLLEVRPEDRKRFNESCIVYGVNERPPIPVALLLAVQNAITTIGGIIFVVHFLSPKLCILEEDPARAYVLSTAVMMAGISTLFQAVLGVRLPIVQSSGFVYMYSTLSVLNSSILGQCSSVSDRFSMGPEKRTLEWQNRVQYIQGSIIAIGLIQMLLGYSGFVGKILKYITPLTVVPTVCIIGLSVFEKGVTLMSGNWLTALITILFLTIFSQYLRKVTIPIPAFTCKKGWFQVGLKIFALFSILLSVGIMWIACTYMTFKNNLPPTDSANTDSKSGVYRNAQMFRLPYPFQWGWPKFNWSVTLAMLPALFINIVESVGNYYTCAKIANLKMPPAGVVNRGIGIQGISSIIAGLLGIGSGVGVSSENVGNIGITRVCCRNVIIYAAYFMILISPFTKIIALLVILPDPILGAVTSMLLTLITAVALSNLQFINLNSIRNMYILGISMFFGLALPKYISAHGSSIYTTIKDVDDIIFVYLSSGMFIGGVIGFILDNTIPDDDDNISSGHPYHVTEDKLKTSGDIEDEKIYKISDRIFEKINYILTLFI